MNKLWNFHYWVTSFKNQNTGLNLPYIVFIRAVFPKSIVRPVCSSAPFSCYFFGSVKDVVKLCLLMVSSVAPLRWGAWTACSRTFGVLCQWCREIESPVKWTCWRLQRSTSGSSQRSSITPLPLWVKPHAIPFCPRRYYKTIRVCVWQGNGNANVFLDTGINYSCMESDSSDLWSMEDVSSLTKCSRSV